MQLCNWIKFAPAQVAFGEESNYVHSEPTITFDMARSRPGLNSWLHMNLPNFPGNSNTPTNADQARSSAIILVKYPDHPKYQQWVLIEVQVADVRVNVPQMR